MVWAEVGVVLWAELQRANEVGIWSLPSLCGEGTCPSKSHNAGIIVKKMLSDARKLKHGKYILWWSNNCTSLFLKKLKLPFSILLEIQSSSFDRGNPKVCLFLIFCLWLSLSFSVCPVCLSLTHLSVSVSLFLSPPLQHWKCHSC